MLRVPVAFIVILRTMNVIGDVMIVLLHFHRNTSDASC